MGVDTVGEGFGQDKRIRLREDVTKWREAASGASEPGLVMITKTSAKQSRRGVLASSVLSSSSQMRPRGKSTHFLVPASWLLLKSLY